MEDAKHLCGEELSKLMMETIIWSSHYKQTSMFKKSGLYEDWEDVEEKYKAKPQILENIKKNGMFMTDPQRGVCMVWMPKFSLEITRSEEHSKTHKRELESTEKVKAPKKIKTEIVDKENQENLSEPPNGQPEPGLSQGTVSKKIGNGQVSRLQKLVAKFEERSLTFNASMIEAEAEEMASEMPKKSIANAKDALKNLEDTLKLMNAMLVKLTASKAEMQELFQNAKDHFDDAGKWAEKVQDLLEDARA